VPTSSPAGTPERRHPGSSELRAMVLAHLTAHPGQSFTPGEIARALGGRSTGAIGNALQTLAAQGEVTYTGTRPRRFAVTTGPPAGSTSSPPSPAPAPRPAPVRSLARPHRAGQRTARHCSICAEGVTDQY